MLFLDAGDAVGDTMTASLTKGRAVVELMNAVGYDARAVGYHESDSGPRGLTELRAGGPLPAPGREISTVRPAAAR